VEGLQYKNGNYEYMSEDTTLQRLSCFFFFHRKQSDEIQPSTSAEFQLSASKMEVNKEFKIKVLIHKMFLFSLYFLFHHTHCVNTIQILEYLHISFG
jgi:hypothetical protein